MAVAKPDFICIGPEKTGTSWLYTNLSSHPEVWLPPVKELRFLNEGNVIPAHSLRNVMFSSHWHYRSLRRRFVAETRLLLSRKMANLEEIRRVQWMFYYCFGRRSMDWYSNLFATDKVSGDISPRYYEIPESKIVGLSDYHPNLRVLIFIRNPIDRAWSKALMVLSRHQKREFEDISRTEFIDFFDSLYEKWVPYVKTVELWKKYFTHVFIGFYDALKNDPVRFYSDICCFLDINENVATSALNKRVYKGSGRKLPHDLSSHLYNQYYQEIKALIDAGYGEYPKRWIENDRSSAGGTSSTPMPRTPVSTRCQ